MTPAASNPAPHPAVPGAAFTGRAVSRREFALIAAVWAAYAMLSVASRLFDQALGGRGQLAGTIAVALAEALCWALLTPPIFALADRVGVEHRRAGQVVAVAAAGVATAVLLGWLGTELRHRLTPFGGPPGPGRAPGLPGSGLDTPPAVAWRGGRPGPPIWFGMLNALVLYLGVLAAGLARAYARRYQARREEAARREARLEGQLAEARLEALRRQLDPHFLFNTLNAVSALVERDPRGVRRMIARLGELLRHSFERGGEAEVPLRDELALLGRYVDIMQVRFQGRLAFETRAADATLDALVPSMIVQPLVENAITHGVERATGPGRVVVDVNVEGAELVLRVSDDGPGLDAAPNATRRQGVGLRNTVARLEQLYGPAQRFTLRPGPLGGAVAEIRLPYHERPGTVAEPTRDRADAFAAPLAHGEAHVG